MTIPDLVYAWSSGKDSAMGLHELQKAGEYNLVSLLTTVTGGYDRVSMHGVRRELLHAQARSLGLPLQEVVISQKSDHEEYAQKMAAVMTSFKNNGVSHVAFADLFLEDVRQYRVDNLVKVGMEPVFPLWKIPTPELAQRFINLGFKTIITCVDTEQLPAEFSGRDFDQSFLDDLPPTVDPCGENGEFHSFAYDGPIFKEPVRFEKGEIVLRDGRYCFCDLMPIEK